MEGKGQLFILVGPSGAGKNTLLAKSLEKVVGLTQMPTCTTRSPREGERDGEQHFFLSEEKFDQLIQEKSFVEWQVVHGKRYGTLKSVVEQGINTGKDYIADIEVLGAFSLKESYAGNVILIFVLPSSMEILEQRIRQRGYVSEDEVAVRLSRVQFELTYMPKCDYVIINDDLEVAIEQLKGIILAERSRRAIMNSRVSNGYPQHIYHNTATGIVLNEQETELLLVKREGGSKSGWWFPPGGHVEPGEYPHEALIREIEEETGYRVEIIMQDQNVGMKFDKTLVMPKPYWILLEDMGNHFHFDMIFVCRVTDRVKEQKSECQFDWFPISEIDQILTPKDVKYLIQKLR
jgi:guanylate kinase